MRMSKVVGWMSVAKAVLLASVSAGPPECAGVEEVAGESIQLELVAPVVRPVDATHAPGDVDRLFVVEARGTIRIVDLATDTLLPGAFLNIQTRVTSGGEQGLLGLAFHPDYDSNGYFYVYYTGQSGGGDSFISRFEVTEDPNVADASSELVLITFDQPRGNHNGGQVLFGPNDGYLYISTGDGGGANDQFLNAQRTSSFLGKILRIDVDGEDPGKNYAIPPDNPFNAVDDGILDEIWALGLRNPWRMAFDSATGDLYIADVGQGAWEEINFQPGDSAGGENYQWSVREGNHNFSQGASQLTAGTSTPPVYEYPHGGGAFRGCSITGGKLYRGCRMPDLRGRYFFADHCNNWVGSFRVVEGEVTELTNHTAELNAGIAPDRVEGISAFGEDARGEIYVCDIDENKLFRIIPVVPPNNPPTAVIATDPQPPTVDFRDGAAAVTLDGSASDDGDGGEQGLTYLWEKVGGPAGDSIATPEAATTDVTFATVGEYVYRLTVDDGQDADNTASAEVTVTVQVRFVRGDSNGDGTRDVSDPIYSLNYLFLGQNDPVCLDALDSNDDGDIDVSDPIHTLSHEFLGSVTIPEPADCGVDPTEDSKDCSTTTCPATDG